MAKHDFTTAFLLYTACGDLQAAAEGAGIPLHLVKAQASIRNWPSLRGMAMKKATDSDLEKLNKRIERTRVKHQDFVLDQLEESQRTIEGMLPMNEDDLTKKLFIIDKHDTIARRTLKLDQEDKSDDPMRQGLMLLVAAQKGNSLTNKPLQLEDASDEED